MLGIDCNIFLIVDSDIRDPGRMIKDDHSFIK